MKFKITIPQFEIKIETEESIQTQPIATQHEVDINGTSWDARIHASTKTKLSDGSWKLKRGVAIETVEKIAEENNKKVEEINKSEEEMPYVPLFLKKKTMADLTLQITEMLKRGEITPTELANKIRELGFENLPSFVNNPDAIDALASKLEGTNNA